MKQNKYLEDISEIKNMMSRSSRFMSLSGLSGILAGIYALIGAFLAKSNMDYYIYSSDSSEILTRTEFSQVYGFSALAIKLLIIAFSVILAATVTGIILTYNKAKKSGEKMWDVSSRRLLINFGVPLLIGGLFCFVLIQQEIAGLVAPTTLIFYGLACVNASKYTLGKVRYLGYTNIIIGLIATQFIGYGLYFWALGFGVFHIFYGALMYFKDEK
ncbi:hypothetical protein [uncultured Maribacter sp.]|uniref:hypothetical protein n=1 Tax=uncultured Maribacter sp. TaxID=431308 RepID=UPI00261CE18C|nr:hypothetical protein [uncultured Maribacter sp.]